MTTEETDSPTGSTEEKAAIQRAFKIYSAIEDARDIQRLTKQIAVLTKQRRYIDRKIALRQEKILQASGKANGGA